VRFYPIADSQKILCHSSIKVNIAKHRAAAFALTSATSGKSERLLKFDAPELT